MFAVKRFGFLASLLIVWALVAPSTAFAGQVTEDPLIPPEISPEPDACGTVTYKLDRSGTTTVTVSCRGLTPRSEYQVVFWVITYYSTSGDGSIWIDSYYRVPAVADKRGKLQVQSSFGPSGGWMPTRTHCLGVWAEDAAGDVVLH